ncbi:hypothetical protein Y1Q_0010862 [Alligator mississippiensis]|uniref:Uncharacterized protein n=1 Tax=Alligator mississippiensis TaxID=8496 RepID=A0A151M756_ALLMI|nr:hypothetical protein Y1Q_0010862 [Alligator mississippiensis]
MPQSVQANKLKGPCGNGLLGLVPVFSGLWRQPPHVHPDSRNLHLCLREVGMSARPLSSGSGNGASLLCCVWK